ENGARLSSSAWCAAATAATRSARSSRSSCAALPEGFRGRSRARCLAAKADFVLHLGNQLGEDAVRLFAFAGDRVGDLVIDHGCEIGIERAAALRSRLLGLDAQMRMPLL